MENKLRQLPSVEKILGQDKLKRLEAEFPHDLIVSTIRQSLESYRSFITTRKAAPLLDEIVDDVHTRIQAFAQSSLRPVINATGVVLHTNLGRAPLSREAIAGMERISRGYSNLEFDLTSGERGSRDVHAEHILCQLTGAEAALVVNNCASAVLLALTALARRKEVIVSRGQAVEIGGGFRIPEVMRQSGARLIEVGTTNCTYARDYEQAITPRTAALLRVHSSNFRVVGFTQTVALEEMIALGNKYNLPVFDDLGSGCLLDTAQFGLDPEPTAQESIKLSVGLAFFSGDKLLGGPQAGIIVGKKDLVAKLKKHPLARATRIDKVRLAGLIVTLIHYLKGEAPSKIPIWRMIAAPVAELDRRANLWAKASGSHAKVIDGESVIGGGSLPGGTLPTRLVAIGGAKTARNLAQWLRSQELPLIGRISGDTLLLDPRSVLPEDDKTVLKILHQAAATLKH